MDDFLETYKEVIVNSLLTICGALLLYYVGTISIPIVILIFLYGNIRYLYVSKFKRFSLDYLYKVFKLKKYSFRIALFYALSLSTLLFYISYLKHTGTFTEWIDKNGLTHLAVFATLLLGIWGLIVSYNVLKQQNTQIVSFNEFLSELRDSFQRLHLKSTNNPKNKYSVYLYDYHPLIGNFSAREKYEAFRKSLLEIQKNPNIKFRLITNHENSLSNFFKKLDIDSDFVIASNSFEAVEFIKTCEDKRIDPKVPNNTLLWKSDSISEFHFVIVDDEAFQYVVLPQKDGKNSVYGVKTEDPFVVNYLENSFNEKLKDIISVSNIVNIGNRYNFYFQPQSNIQFIELIDNHNITYRIVDYIKDEHSSEIKGFSLPQDKINSFEFPIRYRLMKKYYDKNADITSKEIFYRQILESKKSNQQITYIEPSRSLKSENDYLGNCLEQLKKIDAKKILKIDVFYYQYDYELQSLLTELKKITITNTPIAFLTVQPERKIAFEVWTVDSRFTVTHNTKHEINYSKVLLDGVTNYYFAHNPFTFNANLSTNCDKVFDNFKKLLSELKLDYRHIVRQWSYIGDITKTDGNKSGTDNYNIFCEARTKFFTDLGLYPDKHFYYPVATGIGLNPYKISSGVNNNGFAFTAMGTSLIGDNIENIHSKIQNDPFEYSDDVLNGTARPLFQRGKKVKINDKNEYVLVSGTSSIDKEKSHYSASNLILSQVQKTVESIYHLLETSERKSTSIRNMSYVRIYYNCDSNDLATIKSFLNPLIKDIPHIFIHTSVCRDNLKLEIECAML